MENEIKPIEKQETKLDAADEAKQASDLFGVKDLKPIKEKAEKPVDLTNEKGMGDEPRYTAKEVNGKGYIYDKEFSDKVPSNTEKDFETAQKSIERLNQETNENNNSFDPKNPKYKDFARSHITNAKEIETETFTDSNGKEHSISIIEYIPYGSLEDGTNKKLYGVVNNYDGSDAPDAGATVSVSLDSAKKDLERAIKFHIQGSDRFTGRGKYDEGWFNMLKNPEMEWEQEIKDKYSKLYGWDLNNPWEEQEFVKDDPYKKYQESKKIAK